MSATKGTVAPDCPWEKPGTSATLVRMQGRLKDARAETTKHDGDRAAFVAAMRDVVEIGAACLDLYTAPDPS